jgi:L-methionine (R)-S-oxide reductase
VNPASTAAPFLDLATAPTGPPPTAAQRKLAPDVAAMIARGEAHEEVLAYLVGAVHEAFPAYAWTGIYIARDGILEMGPFRGPDSPHHSIRIGTADGGDTQGICGWVAAHGIPQVIPDVNADPRYLMCSAKIRSEIVIPIERDGKVLGVIDIDSETRALFTQTDLTTLSDLARLIAPTFPVGARS